MKTPVLVGLIAGGILGLAFLIALLRGTGPATSPTEGTSSQPQRVVQGAEGEPSLLSPIGFVPHGSLTLTWRRVPGIEEYEAFIYDFMAQKVWRSGRVRDDHVDVPPRIVGRLDVELAYFWYVVAYRPDGEEMRSPDAQFHLQD